MSDTLSNSNNYIKYSNLENRFIGKTFIKNLNTLDKEKKANEKNFKKKARNEKRMQKK